MFLHIRKQAVGVTAPAAKLINQSPKVFVAVGISDMNPVLKDLLAY